MNDHAAHTEEPLEHYRGLLCYLARLQIGPQLRRCLDPEDIVQETFLKAHKARHTCQAKTPLQTKAWLKTILMRTLLDEVKKIPPQGEVSIHDAIKDSTNRLEHFLEADHTTPGTHAIRNEEALIVEEALSELPDRQREAVQLRYWHDWSAAQIGQHLGISTAAVAGLLHRGTTDLAECWPKSEKKNERSP